MKCKACGGTGVKVIYGGGYKREGIDCPKCDGKGEITLTNEEWFCQLSTTEKSEFLSAMAKEAIEVHEKHGTTWHEAVSWWDGWLKQPHRKE